MSDTSRPGPPPHEHTIDHRDDDRRYAAPLRVFRLGLNVTELLYCIPWAYLSADANEPPPPLLANVTGELVRHLARLEELAPESAAAVGALRRATDVLVSATRSAWASAHRRTWVERRDGLAEDGVLEESGARVPTFADAPMRPEWGDLLDASDTVSAALPEGLRVLFDLGRAVGETLDPFEHYRQPEFDPSSWLYETLAPRVEQLLADARRVHPCLATLPELPCGIATGGSPPFDGMTTAIRELAHHVPARLVEAATLVAAPPAVTDHPQAGQSAALAAVRRQYIQSDVFGGHAIQPRVDGPVPADQQFDVQSLATAVADRLRADLLAPTPSDRPVEPAPDTEHDHEGELGLPPAERLAWGYYIQAASPDAIGPDATWASLYRWCFDSKDCDMSRWATCDSFKRAVTRARTKLGLPRRSARPAGAPRSAVPYESR